MKREPPKQNWEIYPCTVRKAFSEYLYYNLSQLILVTDWFYVSDSYESSRAKESQATLQSDVNSESDQQTAMGRGRRNRRVPTRYLSTDPIEENHHSSDESDESVGMYGPTQSFPAPSIPHGLTSNALSQQATDVAQHSPQQALQTPVIPQSNAASQQTTDMALQSTQQAFPTPAIPQGLSNGGSQQTTSLVTWNQPSFPFQPDPVQSVSSTGPSMVNFQNSPSQYFHDGLWHPSVTQGGGIMQRTGGPMQRTIATHAPTDEISEGSATSLLLLYFY